MKRFFSLFLLLSLLLCGCGKTDGQEENSVTFYFVREEYQADYHREEYQYDVPEQVIAAEERTVTSPLNRITYLFSLYLSGPLDSALRSPLPEDCSVAYFSWKDDQLEISLKGSFSNLSDIDMSLARACITYTCLELTHAGTIRIITADPGTGESETAVLSRESFLLDDTFVEAAPENHS